MYTFIKAFEVRNCLVPAYTPVGIPFQALADELDLNQLLTPQDRRAGYAALAIGDSRKTINLSQLTMVSGNAYHFVGTWHNDPGVIAVGNTATGDDVALAPCYYSAKDTPYHLVSSRVNVNRFNRDIIFDVGHSDVTVSATRMTEGSSVRIAYRAQLSRPISLGGTGYTLDNAYFTGTIYQYASVVSHRALQVAKLTDIQQLTSLYGSQDRLVLSAPIAFSSPRVLYDAGWPMTVLRADVVNAQYPRINQLPIKAYLVHNLPRLPHASGPAPFRWYFGRQPVYSAYQLKSYGLGLVGYDYTEEGKDVDTSLFKFVGTFHDWSSALLANSLGAAITPPDGTRTRYLAMDEVTENSAVLADCGGEEAPFFGMGSDPSDQILIPQFFASPVSARTAESGLVNEPEG